MEENVGLRDVRNVKQQHLPRKKAVAEFFQ